MRERVVQNTPGDFYVEANRCIACGWPHLEAPELMNDPDGDWGEGYFRRQPQNEEEVRRAIDAIQCSCIEALRYGGTDADIIKRLHELELGHCCDHPLTAPDTPTQD